MGIAALITWILTALGGSLMLAKWVQGGGHRKPSSTRLSPPIILGHFALAAVGLVLWIIYLAADSNPIGWIAFVLLVPVALLGFAMLIRWIPTYQASRNPAAVGAGSYSPGPDGPMPGEGAAPPERHFPVAVVGGHGVLAVVTVVLVLLTNLGIGGS
ncbi:hypothetical protein [Aldersonia kunmingensis]|uniref:hypothetical protein n=1 Tax=Aldersonia kunmingensis TaxID=408066 RepID=UPI00082FC052|nr:hypothetical protein [Aldersonia kunmingensis]